MLRCGLVGITGRMGNSLLDLLEYSKECVCVGGIAKHDFELWRNIPFFLSMDSLCDEAEVILDFSSPKFTDEVIEACVKAGRPLVLGTTGLLEMQKVLIRKKSKNIPIFYSENFSIGIHISACLSKMVASVLDEEYDIEILETHHRNKEDSPSGTALFLKKACAEGRKTNDINQELPIIRGKRKQGEICISSRRGGSVVGEHSVSFFGSDEIITIEHKVLDRHVFAKGALKAAMWILSKDPGLYSMKDLVACDINKNN